MTLDEAETIDDGMRQFVLWGLAMLGVTVANSEGDEASLEIPDLHRAFFHDASSARLMFGNAMHCAGQTVQSRGDKSPADGGSGSSTDEVKQIPVDERFIAWLIGELQSSGEVLSGVPTLPVSRVHEISARIFEAYTVEGGTAHLSGCTLEERPVLRRTEVLPGPAASPRLLHHFFDTEGTCLLPNEVEALGLSSVRPPMSSLPLLNLESVLAWCRAAVAKNAVGDSPAGEDAFLNSVIWCPFAAGKIEFVIGTATAEVTFSGWARSLALGLVAPPAFQCPVTGVCSHGLAATDDGRITAQEAIEVCAVSGRRVLSGELKQCELTGKAVMPEFLETCPVSGQAILATELTACGTCQQMVSPTCLQQGICEACRTMTPIGKDDPRMARVLGEYPRLDRWRRWRIGETSTAYVLVAAALIKRMLVVVNKESLELTRLATRSRFSSRWVEPPLTERQELLQ